MKLRTTVRTLSVVVGAVIIAGVSALGCSGADFTASDASGGDAGMASGGVSSAGDAGSAGTLVASAGNGGHPSAGGAAAGGTSPALGGMAGAAELGGGGTRAAGAGGELETAGASASAGAGDGGDTSSAGAAGACNAVPWFPDGDGDHFGRSSGQVVACDPPASGVWVSKGGDCNDDNVAVFPTEADYEPEGYTSSSSVLSFDYNCSGIEEVDPTAKGLAPNCAALGVLNCAGVGFKATARSGPGVNPLCGSKTQVTCTKSGLNCVAVAVSVSEGVRCH